MLQTEYEHVLRRISDNERRRYQTFVICLAGFGAVIGFGQTQGGAFLIPPGLAAVFVLCSREYWVQSHLQRINSNFVALKYERANPQLNYATMDKAVSYGGSGTRWGAFVTDPMFLLSIISVAGAWYYSKELISPSSEEHALDGSAAIGFVAVVAALHLAGLFFILRNHAGKKRSLRGLEEFLREPPSPGSDAQPTEPRSSAS